MNCKFVQQPDGTWKCTWCGWKYKRTTSKWPKRNCPKAPSRGLGDTIAKMAKAMGVNPCSGCKKRQEFLNKLVPYKEK